MVKKEISSYGDISHFNEKGEYHREDGPALEFTNGYKAWCINGMRHRIDGPAVEDSAGQKFYYVMSKHYSYEDWLAIKDFPLLW